MGGSIKFPALETLFVVLSPVLLHGITDLGLLVVHRINTLFPKYLVIHNDLNLPFRNYASDITILVIDRFE